MPKMLSDGDDLLLWIPANGIDVLGSPTVAELTATGVLDISCLVTKANFALGATGNENIDDPALCAKGSSPAPGNATYEAAMDFFRWTTEEEDEAWNTFTGKGIPGLLAHRVGKPHEFAIAAAQEFAIYGVLTGTPQRLVPETNGGFRKFRQAFMVQSEQVNERAKVAA